MRPRMALFLRVTALLSLGVLLALSIYGLSGCASPNRAAKPSADDCLSIGVWSNGLHTSLALPTAFLPAGHPVRRLFPQARHVLIGYGEAAFYQDEDPGLLRTLDAITPPSPAVLHIIASETGPVERTLWRPRTFRRVALSQEGVARLAAEIEASLALDADGAAQRVGEGRVAGRSAFVRARPGFHLFHMCNHWTAARLRAAGVDVNPRWSFHAPWLTDALVRNALDRCPPQVD